MLFCQYPWLWVTSLPRTTEDIALCPHQSKLLMHQYSISYLFTQPVGRALSFSSNDVPHACLACRWVCQHDRGGWQDGGIRLHPLQKACKDLCCVLISNYECVHWLRCIHGERAETACLLEPQLMQQYCCEAVKPNLCFSTSPIAWKECFYKSYSSNMLYFMTLANGTQHVAVQHQPSH